MFKPLAALLIPVLVLAAGAAPGRPFTAKDLADAGLMMLAVPEVVLWLPVQLGYQPT